MTLARQAFAPVVVVALAVGLWWISDRLLYIGPMDRATFGGVVVMPLWAAAPAFAGFAWRGISAGARTRSAAIAGAAVSSVAVVVIWSAVAAPAVGCTPTRTTVELIARALPVAAIVGGGFFLACRVASEQVAAGRIGRGVIYGAVIQLLVVPAASTLAFAAFYGLCQRPVP